MANGAFMKRDYVNAEKLFVTVIQRLMSKGGSENDLNILHISLKLAKIYEAQNDNRYLLIFYGYKIIFNFFSCGLLLLKFVVIKYFSYFLNKGKK